MLPALIHLDGAPWQVLPEGIHSADLDSIRSRFACNPWRRQLFGGFWEASANLAMSGCRSLYLDGSFVSDKPKPNDYDACWNPHGVDRRKLDPAFFDLRNRRAAQKEKFFGEFFPSTTMADAQERNFVDFFQLEKFTGKPKGIVLIDLTAYDMLKPQVKP